MASAISCLFMYKFYVVTAKFFQRLGDGYPRDYIPSHFLSNPPAVGQALTCELDRTSFADDIDLNLTWIFKFLFYPQSYISSHFLGIKVRNLVWGDENAYFTTRL